MTLNVYFASMNDDTYEVFSAIRKERYPDIKCWINKSDARFKNIGLARDVHTIDNLEIDNNIECYEYAKGDGYIIPNHDLLYLLSRKQTCSGDFVCIDNIIPKNNKKILFQDIRDNDDYPKDFFKLYYFDSFASLYEYAKSKGVIKFSLDDSNRFQKTSRNEQGASVYEEISTGRIWYLDMFHKNHYEVFDSTGKNHLGEADMNGVLDTSKHDKKKKI